MGRGMVAGGTDYSHQSLKDIETDLDTWIINLKDTSEILHLNIESLTESGYLQKVDPDFTSLVHYSMKFFTTSIQEISEILADIQHEVRLDHVTRLRALGETARQLNVDYGQTWHREYKNKEYGNKDFALVEKMYGEGRDMAGDMIDLSNLSSRLEDFIGRKPKGKTAPNMNQNAPPAIADSLSRFVQENPDPAKTCFIMMQFGTTRLHNEIVEGIRAVLDSYGISGLRADDRQYHDDLFPNVLTYMYGCGFGIAVFERLETNDFNPNVSLELGYMLALGKPVCLLKDRTLRTLNTDLVGKLYKSFDPQDPSTTMAPELEQWLKDKGLL